MSKKNKAVFKALTKLERNWGGGRGSGQRHFEENKKQGNLVLVKVHHSQY